MVDQLTAARLRARHTLEHLRTSVEALASHLADDIPTSGARQSVTQTAATLCEQLAVIDALRYGAESAARQSPSAEPDDHP